MIRAALLRIATRRPPDFVVGGEANPYLRRWWVIPRNPFFNVYLHQFLRSDDDRALHDHPWLFNFSWLLKGAYLEWVPPSKDAAFPCQNGAVCVPDLQTPSRVTAMGYFRTEGAVKFRWGRAPHRIELHRGKCWTLFITGPRVREWGFYCPQGWKHWRDFTAPGQPGEIGPGCDE